MAWEELVAEKLQEPRSMDKKAAVGDEKRPGYVCRKCYEAFERYLKL